MDMYIVWVGVNISKDAPLLNSPFTFLRVTITVAVAFYLMHCVGIFARENGAY